MSRRKGNNKANQKSQMMLRVRTEMLADGKVEVDPVFNRQAIENLDQLYDRAQRDDYDHAWGDDHKIAYFLFQIFDEILSRYEPERSSSDLDPAPGVPNLRDAPVRDVVDISRMPRGVSNLN